MKHLLSIIMILCLVACSSNKIKVNFVDEGIEKVHIDTMPMTFGVPYHIEECESESGYCVIQDLSSQNYPSIDRSIYGEVLVQNSNYFISRFENQYQNDEGYFVSEYSYSYSDYKNRIFFHVSNDSLDNEKVLYDKINEKAYFYYVENNEVILNVIKDGNLIELERKNIKFDETAFSSIELHNDKIYYIYQSDSKFVYILDETTYEFGKYDEIVLLDDYIFVSVNNKSKMVSTYIIDLSTSEKIECNQVLDVKSVYSINNQFLYKQATAYHLIKVDSNEIKSYDLNISCSQDDLWGLGIMKNNPNDVIFMIGNGNNIEVDLIRIIK